MGKNTTIAAAGIFFVATIIAGLPQMGDAAEIHGCVSIKKGTLRIVSSFNECTSKEWPISWNQQGPPGVASGVSRVVMGKVAANGTIESGTGFQISKDTSTSGIYYINFTPDFSSMPFCLCAAGPYAIDGLYAVCGIWTSKPPLSEQIVTLIYPGNGTMIDWDFGFICAEKSE